jgi:hypothetical protein
MHDPAKGEFHSPGTGKLEWSGTGRCKNPTRVALAGLALRCWSGEARRRSIDTLRCRLARQVTDRAHQACERGSGEVRGKVFAVRTLEGQNPREAPVAVGLIRRMATRHSWQE